MNKPVVLLVTTATSSSRTAEENLGLGYIAAACREKDINAIIIDGWLEELTSEDIINRILDFEKPIFVGFSCNLLTGDVAIDIVKKLKDRGYNIPFVAGGFSPTLNPKKFLDAGFDFISMAEGERTLVNLCEYFLYKKLDLSQIVGLAYYDKKGELHYKKNECVSNLDELSFPSRDTIDYVMKNKIPVNVSTSRGCFSSCLFCSVAAFWRTSEGVKWRGRSINNIVDELEQLYHKGARYFKFVDDSFIEPPRGTEWCNSFADEINKRGLDIRFRITMRADRVSEELVDALCRAGCNSIVIGIENFNCDALKRMGKIANREINIKALDCLKKFDLYILHGFILFDYATTFEELKDNYELMNKYSWAICKGIFSEMYAATGTRYTEILRKQGLIKSDAHYENYEYDIIDARAKMVYDALKAWHISHVKMYDMMIEPINKPRVLSEDGLKRFYDLYVEVRRRDLNFMKHVLDLVEADARKECLNDFVSLTIRENIQWFEECQNKVDKLYCLEGIKCMAEEDPFT